MPLLEGHRGWIRAEPDDADHVTWKKPWKAPTMVQVGPHLWRASGPPLNHKTPVTVVRQLLSHGGYGYYKGVLEVELDGGKHVFIDVSSFAYRPYWACPLRSIDYSTGLWRSSSGVFVAKCAAGVRSVNRQGEWVTLKKGEHLLCDSEPHKGHNHLGGDIVDCKVLTPQGRARDFVEVRIQEIDIVY